MVPDLRVFPSLVYLGDLLVESRLRVEIVPERLAVVRISTSSIVLLRAIVHERDASAGHREDYSSCKGDVVSIVMQEARVVVIVNEHSKSINVLEFVLLLIVPVSNIGHALL